MWKPAQFLALLLAASRVAAWSHATEAGLRKAIRSNEYTLVAFVLPEQQSSSALEPEWVSIQETERDNNVVSFDCHAKPNVCAELDVISYPSIRLYSHGATRVDRYRGPRRAKPIVGFLRRALRPTVAHVGEKNVTSFLSVDDVVVIGHIAPGESSIQQRFQDLAEKYHDRLSFALSSDFGNEPVLGCYNNVDDVQRSTSELSGVDALDKFVKICSTPLIPELTRRNELELMSTGKSMVHYFHHSADERDEYQDAIRPLAKKYQEYLLFDTVDINEYPDMVTMMGLAAGSRKALSVQNPSNGDVFPYRGGAAISAEVVEAFLIDIINGKIKPWTSKDEVGGHDEL